MAFVNFFADSDNQLLEEDSYSEGEDGAGAQSIYDVQPGSPKKSYSSLVHKPFLHFTT